MNILNGNYRCIFGVAMETFVKMQDYLLKPADWFLKLGKWRIYDIFIENGTRIDLILRKNCNNCHIDLWDLNPCPHKNQDHRNSDITLTSPIQSPIDTFSYLFDRIDYLWSNSLKISSTKASYFKKTTQWTQRFAKNIYHTTKRLKTTFFY